MDSVKPLSVADTGTKWYAGRKSDVAKSNLEFANRARQMALEQDYWQQQFDIVNQYNSPAQQLQRLWDANINPLFGLGSGFSGASNASVSSPSPSSYGISGSSSGGLSTGMNFASELLNGVLSARRQQMADKMQKTSVEKLESEIRKNDADTRSTDVRTDFDIEKRGLELERLQKQNNLTDKEIEQRDAMVANIKQQTDASVRELDLKWRNLQELIRHNKESEKVAVQNANTDLYSARQLASYHQGVLKQGDERLDLDAAELERRLKIDESAQENKLKEIELRYREYSDKKFFDFLNSTKLSVAGTTLGYNDDAFIELIELQKLAADRINQMSPTDPDFARYADIAAKKRIEVDKALDEKTGRFSNVTNKDDGPSYKLNRLGAVE